MAVLLAVVLVASSSLAGLTPLSGNPLESGEPGQTEGPADNLTDHPLIPEPAPEEPWWDEWLDRFDKSGTRVDDEAEEVARALIEEGRPDAPVSVLVTYKETPTEEDTALLMDRFHADPEAIHVLATGPTVLAEIPARFVTDLGSIPGVAAVEWDYPLERVLTISAPSTQAREFIGSSTTNQVYNGMTAQALGYTGTGTVIAVIDTGIQPTHPAVSGKIIATADSSTIATVQCTVSHDIDGHGTHVASTAAGNPPNDNRKGTAMDASLVDVQISKQIITIGGIQRGLNWVFQYNNAIDQGDPRCGVGLDDRIDVATVSFGSAGRGGPNAGSTESTINALTNQGVVVTIAVGNCGPQASALCNFSDVENGISSPGNAANAIGVAASSHGNTVERNNDNLAGFSSRGPNSGTGASSASNLQDRHRKPDITGPGVGISAANAFHITGPDYVSMSGTSMSTPHLAGIAALLIEAGEDARSQIGGPNLMQPNASVFTSGNYVMDRNPVRDALIFSADYRTANVPSSMLTKWEGPNSLGTPWNNGWGYGSVDAFAAICWAWANVLEPAGATPPATVTATCPSTLLSANAGGPYDGTAGEPITFTGSAQGGEDPYTFEWDLGDGNTTTGTQPQHTYAIAGTYTVQLTITDDEATVETDTTTATVAEPDPGPPAEPEPFVNITDPEDGDSVEGNVTITGIAGHTGNSEESTQSSTSGTTTGEIGLATTAAPLATVAQNNGLSLEPGSNTLWFRGENLNGIGMPNIADQQEAWLLPEAPTNTVPVAHSGSDSLDSRLIFTSPPLEHEIRLGDGDPNTQNEAAARFHLATWTHLLQGDNTLNAQLNAITGDDVLPLGTTSIRGAGIAPHLREIAVPLGQGLTDAPVNPDGDLVVPEGYRLQFVFWVQRASDVGQQGLAYTVFYDAVDFESHIEFFVNGGPRIATFDATPLMGEAPLNVTFSGTAEPGVDALNRITINPGDGSGSFDATLTGNSFQGEHTYTGEGAWEASATAVDVEGRTGSASVSVTVSVTTTEREEGVYLTIGGGSPLLAQDSSAAQDWSSWELEHDFSVYGNGSVVPVQAVYFNGTDESTPHNITVTVGSLDDEPEDPPEDPPEDSDNKTAAQETVVEIAFPSEGAEVSPDFRANGTTTTTSSEMEEGDPSSMIMQNQNIAGGLTAKNGFLSNDGAFDSDHFALHAVDDPAFAAISNVLSTESGFAGLGPALDGTQTLYALFKDGKIPSALPTHLLPAGWNLKAKEVELQPLVLENVTVVDTSGGHRDGPPVPETAQGIGPGSRIVMNIPGHPTSACTANFVWEDQDRNLYLGSAGHCFLPSSATTTHGSGTDYNPQNTLARVCIANCNFGGQTGFVISGQLMQLDVVYARQEGRGTNPESDFGLLRIPDEARHLVRTHMPVWDGPVGQANIAPGAITLHYGNAGIWGEAWPTMARGGVAVPTLSGSNSWMAVHASWSGDSGSGVSRGVVQTDSTVLRGDLAGGVLTHGICDAVIVCVATSWPTFAVGPTLSRVQQNTLADAGLQISLRTEGPVPPGPPRALDLQISSGEAILEWDDPQSDGGAPIMGYTVKWGTNQGGPYPNTVEVADRTTTIMDLEDGQAYFVVVSATNGAGEGPDSQEIDFTPSGPPGRPQDLVAIPGDGSVTMNWDEPASDGGAPVTHYTMKWGTDEGGPYPDTMNVTESMATVTGLVNGQTYFFVVSATNVAGTGSDSDEVSAVPGVPAVQVRLLNATGVVLDWGPVDHYDGSSWFHDFTGVPVGNVTLQARFMADNEAVSEDEVSFTVVMPNRPPQLDPIEDRSVVEGSTLQFMVSASDPDGDPVVLSAQPLPEGAVFTDHGNDSGTFDWTPEMGQAGEYEVTFSAFDGEFFDNETIVIVVDGKEVHPFVEITSPSNGSAAHGETLIEGIAGSASDTQGSVGAGTSGSSLGSMSLPAGTSLQVGPSQGVGLSLEPGSNTLWFRGENLNGIGIPNIADQQEAWLLPEAPTNTVPVAHPGSDSLDSRLIFTSPPLEHEIRLGDGDPSTQNEAAARFHLATWTHLLQGDNTLNAQLNAITGDEVLPLGTTSIRGAGIAPHLREIAVPLGQGLTDAPVNPDGDLVVPEGYRLQFVFWVQRASDVGQQGLAYTVFYDAVDFESQIVIPVSDRTGSPSIIAFDASPSAGGLPLEVTFAGLVEAGATAIDRVELDPGDGSGAFNATLDGEEFHAQHTYREAGIWEARATVVDMDGRETTSVVSINVTLEEGVYLRFQGGPLEKALDTSESGDWSSWQILHDLDAYDNGTKVTVEALFFDGSNLSDPHVITLIVGPDEPPEAVIHGPDRVGRDQNATFTGSESQGAIEFWSWDFGDGTTAEGMTVTHAWSQPGPKTVTLTVRDVAGVEDTTTHRVHVTGRPASGGPGPEGGGGG